MMVVRRWPLEVRPGPAFSVNGSVGVSVDNGDDRLCNRFRQTLGGCRLWILSMPSLKLVLWPARAPRTAVLGGGLVGDK